MCGVVVKSATGIELRYAGLAFRISRLLTSITGSRAGRAGRTGMFRRVIRRNFRALSSTAAKNI